MIEGITILIEDEETGDDVAEIPNIEVAALRAEAEQNPNGIAALLLHQIDAYEEA